MIYPQMCLWLKGSDRPGEGVLTAFEWNLDPGPAIMFLLKMPPCLGGEVLWNWTLVFH